jgi:DNA-binding PadR family transcriptional regulator
MMLAEDLEILSHFSSPRNPHEVYRSNGFRFSRATFYRRLEKLKEQGLIEWRVGEARLTERGKALVDAFRVTTTVNQPVRRNDFRLFEAERLKDIVDESFVYVDYPTAGYILSILMKKAGVEEKGLKSNVEKLQKLKGEEFRVKLAINHFENVSRQALVFLEELIKEGKIEALWVGVKNERKALKNKKLVEFLQSHDFENERFKLPKESVTLFPLFLIGIIGVIMVLALRSGYQHAPLLSVLMVVYFMRSMLFRELREI